MKKNLLTIISICIASFALAQEVILTPTDSLYEDAIITSEFDEVTSTAFVENTTTDTLDFTWRIIEIANNTPSEWEMTLCDNTQCPVIFVNQVQNFKLAPDSSSILKFGILPFSTAGGTQIKVRVFAAGTSFDTVMTYKTDIEANITSVRSIDSESLSIFPNPASNQIKITGLDDVSSVDRAEVYSVIGRKLIAKNISSQGDLQFNISNFESGIYLVKLFDKSQKVFYTKTFIKD